MSTPPEGRSAGQYEWRGYDIDHDSPEAGVWDQGHGEVCVYWPDCQENGDHPNPHIYPPGAPGV